MLIRKTVSQRTSPKKKGTIAARDHTETEINRLVVPNGLFVAEHLDQPLHLRNVIVRRRRDFPIPIRFSRRQGDSGVMFQKNAHDMTDALLAHLATVRAEIAAAPQAAKTNMTSRDKI